MKSELLNDETNKSSESNSFRLKNIGQNMKNTIERLTTLEADKIGDKLKRTDQQQFQSTTHTTTISNNAVRKQLINQHRFTVNDILSPLNNIGK
ncbi:Cysteine protease inhibitor [Dirofilaria immitis]